MIGRLSYITCHLCLIVLVSCTDLEETLVGEVTEDIQISGPPVFVVDYVGTPYEELRYIGLASHGSYFSVQELTSDELFLGVRGSDWNTDGTFIRLHRHTYTPNNLYLNYTWTALYNAIDWTNQSFSWIGNRPEYRPEYRAIRAYFYLNLLDMFGRVKLVTEDDPNPPQASREEVFNFVERELLDALEIDELSEAVDLSDIVLYDGDNPYRINQHVVLGLLARLYLNAEVYTGSPRYDKAEIAANLVINSGKYHLCAEGCKVTNLGRRLGVATDPEDLEGYAAVFAANNDHNPEHIFAVRFDRYSGGMNFSQMNLHSASQRSWRLAEQPWNGYATLQEFYNSYEENDLRKAASFLAGPQLDFEGSAILDYQFDDEKIQLDYTPAVNELEPNTLRQAGVRAKKFSFQLFGEVNMENDFPILRLGEMYLIRAEAKARQGDNWAAAETDVNILRARAGVAPYSGTLTADEFLAERGREMFHETVRRTDLIRFGKYNDAWWEKPASEPFRNVFPIPLQQLNTDHGLTQNPGY